METDDTGSPVVVVVVRCPAEPIQQEEKGSLREGKRRGAVLTRWPSLKTLTRFWLKGRRPGTCTMATECQAESAKDTSGKLRVMYSFRVHTATTRVPAAVKKASNPEPLLVKKLGASKTVMSDTPCLPRSGSLALGRHTPTCTVVFAGGAGWELR